MTSAVSTAVSVTPERESSARVVPEIMLPEQFFSSRLRQLWGERRLVFAVLEEAVACYKANAGCSSTRGRRLFREVEDWFGSEDTEPFSFLYVCDVVDLDPGYVRGALARWTAARQRCGAPAVERTWARRAQRYAHRV